LYLFDGGLGKGNEGCTGGEGNRGESDSDKLVSSSFSLRSSSSRHLFLAFLLGGGAIGEALRAANDGVVG
jgi:hypothetical protein